MEDTSAGTRRYRCINRLRPSANLTNDSSRGEGTASPRRAKTRPGAHPSFGAPGLLGNVLEKRIGTEDSTAGQRKRRHCIDSFFEVHRELGFGFREYLYARALERLLIEKGHKSTGKSRSWSKKARFYRVFFENRFKHRNK